VHIVLVILDLRVGGAERDLCRVASFLVKDYKVTLVTLIAPKQKNSFYPLDPMVNLVQLDLMRSLKDTLGFWRRIKELWLRPFCILRYRAALKCLHPDVVISYLTKANILTLFATRGLSVPVIVSERIDPAYHRLGFFHPLWDFIRLCTYRWAFRVTVQTQDALHYFSKHFPKRLMVIPNSVVKPYCAVIINPTVQHIVTTGRLCFQKGQETLLQAFSLIQTNHPTLQLSIYGEGHYRAYLEHMIHEKGLHNHVFLPGMVANVQEVLLQADLFVFPSRYEGFPNALCEAMAVGVPVIASNCSGNTTVVQDGVDGLLFPIGDVQALTQKMEFLIENFDERQRLSQNARYLPERFSENLNHQLWKEVITKAIRFASSEKC
jgi:glycosyltransferase involved in cell wall biosynthesis